MLHSEASDLCVFGVNGVFGALTLVDYVLFDV